MIRFENALKRSSQDVLKTSWRRFCKTSWRRFEDVLARRVEDVLKMSWRRLDDWSRRPEDVSKTSSEDVWVRQIYSSWSSCLEDVFWRRKTSSEDERRLHQDERFPGTIVPLWWHRWTIQSTFNFYPSFQFPWALSHCKHKPLINVGILLISLQMLVMLFFQKHYTWYTCSLNNQTIWLKASI